MSKLIPLIIPYRGLNTLEPKNIAYDSGFAREFTNCTLINGHVGARPAVRFSGVYTDGSATFLNWFAPSGGDTYGIEETSPGNIVQLFSGATSADIGGQCTAPATVFKHSTIEVLCGCREPRSPFAPDFTDHGFTLSGLSGGASTVIAGCSYNGRPYFTDGTKIVYGDIGQITGAFATDRLAGGTLDPTEHMAGNSILRILPLTIQQGNEASQVFVIFGSDGRVLVYAGAWPDSSDWELIAAYDMPAPSSAVSIFEKDGDIIVGTIDYPYFFRELFQEGALSAYKNRISKPIENLWQALTWTADEHDAYRAHTYHLKNINYGESGYDKSIDALVFQCSDAESAGLDRIAENGNPTVSLVYFRRYEAWALWIMEEFLHPVKVGVGGTPSYDAVGSNGEVKLFVADTLEDGSGPFYASWKTPYVSPYEGHAQQVDGVRPFFKNTESGYLHQLNTIFDFSDDNAPWAFWTQPSVTDIPPGVVGMASLDEPANTYGIYNALMNPGGMGLGVSFHFVLAHKSGGASDIALEILGGMAKITDGGVVL